MVFLAGNGIIFDGANFNGDTFSYSGTTLTVTGTGGTKLVMNNISGAGLTSASFKASGNEILIVCYAAGTHILTPTGEQLVEDLAAGEEVLTWGAKLGRRSGSNGSAAAGSL